MAAKAAAGCVSVTSICMPALSRAIRSVSVLNVRDDGSVSETTSSRLLTLLSLLQGRRDWPGSELADRLEVSARTVRRDVERLRSLGYPVESMTGPAGGYQLRAGTAMPPLLLDDDEAIAIAVGLRTAAGGSISGIEETAVRALVKLEQVLPSHLRRRVQALTAATQTLNVYGGPTVDPQALTVLAAAVRDHERVRFAYTARDRAGTQRETEPHSLVNAGRRWYLVAFDCGREDWRTFRVDRIERPGVHRRALPPARAPGQGRRRVRLALAAVLPVALRGARHRRVRRRRSCRAGAGSAATSRRSARRAASCAPPTTTSTGSRCGSR